MLQISIASFDMLSAIESYFECDQGVQYMNKISLYQCAAMGIDYNHFAIATVPFVLCLRDKSKIKLRYIRLGHIRALDYTIDKSITCGHICM